MATFSIRNAVFVAVLATVLYRSVLQNIFTKLGVGRATQPIGDFPYQCRRIGHEELQACEDLWLDEKNRQLYLACSNVAGRRLWTPNVGRINESSISMNDAIYAMSIDTPVGNSYKFHRLATSAFYGTAGEGSLHGLSVSGRPITGSSKLELYIVNNKPSLRDPTSGTSDLADNTKTGANSTVELFEVQPGSSSMQHIRTFSHPLIATPNNVAPVQDGSGFYISNDHGLSKTGLKYSASPLLFSGNVVYCTNPGKESKSPPTCKIVAKGLSFPNGLAIHPSDPQTLYVPSTNFGHGVTIFKIHPDGSLTKLAELKVPYPIDNLSPSIDDGSIYAAAFPKVLKTLDHFEDAASYDPSIAVQDRRVAPATVLRISKQRNLVNDGKELTWSWEKVLEDQDGLVLPAATVAVKDGKTGRLFVSGVYSYFLAVCEPR